MQTCAAECFINPTNVLRHR